MVNWIEQRLILKMAEFLWVCYLFSNLGQSMHGQNWNFGISFPGNCAFGEKSLQFWEKIYHLDGFLKMCKQFYETFNLFTLWSSQAIFGRKIIIFATPPVLQVWKMKMNISVCKETSSRLLRISVGNNHDHLVNDPLHLHAVVRCDPLYFLFLDV